MLISQLCSIIIFCSHLLSQSAADAGRLVCVIQQFALTDSDKGAMSSLGEWGMRGVREGGGKFSMEKWNPEQVIECSAFLPLWLVVFLGNSLWD